MKWSKRTEEAEAGKAKKPHYRIIKNRTEGLIQVGTDRWPIYNATTRRIDAAWARKC